MWWRREKGKEMARKYKALRILAPAGGILEDNINQVGGGYVDISLDQNKLFVSESLVPLTQLAKWYKEPTKQFSELQTKK